MSVQTIARTNVLPAAIAHLYDLAGEVIDFAQATGDQLALETAAQVYDLIATEYRLEG
jgi:hypothetical protein